MKGEKLVKGIKSVMAKGENEGLNIKENEKKREEDKKSYIIIRLLENFMSVIREWDTPTDRDK